MARKKSDMYVQHVITEAIECLEEEYPRYPSASSIILALNSISISLDLLDERILNGKETQRTSTESATRNI